MVAELVVDCLAEGLDEFLLRYGVVDVGGFEPPLHLKLVVGECVECDCGILEYRGEEVLHVVVVGTHGVVTHSVC